MAVKIMKGPSSGVKKAVRSLIGGAKKTTDCKTTTGSDSEDVQKARSRCNKELFDNGRGKLEKVDCFEKNGNKSGQRSGFMTDNKANEKSSLKRFRSVTALSKKRDFKKEFEKTAPGSNACDIIRHRLGSVRKRFRRPGKSNKEVSLKNHDPNSAQILPTRRLSDASETLRNCMNRLEYLSQRLDTVSLVSLEMEHYQELSRSIKPQHDISTEQGNVSSSELIKDTNSMKTDDQNWSKRVRSDENSLHDCETSRDITRCSSLPDNPAADLYSHDWSGASWKDTSRLSHVRQKHFSCESLSSGYSSASSGVQSLNWYLQQPPSACFDENYYYPSFIAPDTQYPDCFYGFEQGYKNPYVPDSIISSGIFEEDMHYADGSYQDYQPAYNTYSPQLSNSCDLQFADDAFYRPAEQLYSFTDMDSMTGFPQCPFVMPSEKQELKKFGSFRYRNGERTAVIVGSGNQKRKTVRFSKTVKEKTEGEKTEKEVASPTSEEEEDAESDAFLSEQLHDTDLGFQEAYHLTHSPIYEFPSGHIEKSCMCSDCILARGSCQLQPTENFVYY